MSHFQWNWLNCRQRLLQATKRSAAGCCRGIAFRDSLTLTSEALTSDDLDCCSSYSTSWAPLTYCIGEGGRYFSRVGCVYSFLHPLNLKFLWHFVFMNICQYVGHQQMENIILTCDLHFNPLSSPYVDLYGTEFPPVLWVYHDHLFIHYDHVCYWAL